MPDIADSQPRVAADAPPAPSLHLVTGYHGSPAADRALDAAAALLRAGRAVSMSSTSPTSRPRTRSWSAAPLGPVIALSARSRSASPDTARCRSSSCHSPGARPRCRGRPAGLGMTISFPNERTVTLTPRSPAESRGRAITAHPVRRETASNRPGPTAFDRLQAWSRPVGIRRSRAVGSVLSFIK